MTRENVANINCAAAELDQPLVYHFDRLHLEGKGFSAGQKLLSALLFPPCTDLPADCTCFGRRERSAAGKRSDQGQLGDRFRGA